MAEWLVSALAQEAVSRSVSFGLSRREEKASQGHLMERLQMAVSELEFALERAKELPIRHVSLPIRHVSLLGRRKQIKSAYVEAVELLDKHKQQAAPVGQEEILQGVKRKRWILYARDMSITPSVGLSTDDVRRFEWYADCAGKFVRDVESGCSLHHYNFCNPIVRHLLEGKTLRYYHLDHENLERGFYIWPTYSDERGWEAVLEYSYDNSIMNEKSFFLSFFLRLSESTDIVGAAISGLQLFTSDFKLAAEFAMGELTQLSNLQDIAHSYGPPWMGIQEKYTRGTQFFRPDPACCKGSRHGLCANNNVSSELLSEIFPEQVIYWSFECYCVPALGPRLSCSFDDVVGTSKSTGGGKPHLLQTAVFAPHDVSETQDSYAIETIGDHKEYRHASMQQVADAIKSDAINCFFHQPELKRYKIFWRSKHGGALFEVEKASMKRTCAPKTRRYTRKHKEKWQEVARSPPNQHKAMRPS